MSRVEFSELKEVLPEIIRDALATGQSYELTRDGVVRGSITRIDDPEEVQRAKQLIKERGVVKP